MTRRIPREFWAYLLLQLPDILLAGLILLLLHKVIAPGTAVTVRGTRGLTLLVEGECATDPKEARGDLP